MKSGRATVHDAATLYCISTPFLPSTNGNVQDKIQVNQKNFEKLALPAVASSPFRTDTSY